jgi:hypothetical protein
MIYNGVGVWYNQKYHRLYGPEAVPHIDKWRELPQTLRNLFSIGTEKAIIYGALARGYVKTKL